MRIPSEKLEEFKAIYKARFGKDLTDAEALEKGTQALRMMELIYRPMTKEDLAMVEARRKELGIDRTES